MAFGLGLGLGLGLGFWLGCFTGINALPSSLCTSIQYLN